MSAVALVLALLGSVICIAFGVARLFGAILDIRDASRYREFRAQQLVAMSRAEVRRG
ncbi:hypothetical protein OK348_12160 [Flavobacterium sp. MXW15]|uniref:Uncharacterized protein n=1 Tax=Xanthomonas chitinilytica TaxID=2989819 RepID=A0ABT3JY38_9XANT|nr:hypothetical protein [Xanthomonas sp. H13-6]MCW4455540.1 hypothetical protein [Flavobacterium sp. MXW15]MCW4473379.1 hypothetical protein [Xanthomonas sp. H13-6]